MNKIIIPLFLIAVFTLGWSGHSLYEDYFHTEITAGLSYVVGASPEMPSPKDRVSERNIHVYRDKVILDLPNTYWAKFTDTNSMDPLLDAGANAIEIAPKYPEDIVVGDIASYSTSQGTIIHRVIETGYDEHGWYALFKGDNNPTQDPEKVRFKQIKRVVVAVIY